MLKNIASPREGEIQGDTQSAAGVVGVPPSAASEPIASLSGSRDAFTTDLKLHRIDPGAVRVEGAVLPWLRDSWVYRKLKDPLKKIPFVLVSVRWLVRKIHYYRRYFSIPRTERRWRWLTRLSDHANQPGVMIHQLLDQTVVQASVVPVFPARERSHLIVPDDRYTFPSVFVTTVLKATVYGNTNLVLDRGVVLCHDLYNFERDYTSEELHGRAIFDDRSDRIRWLDYDPVPVALPSGAVFVDACASNYAHWVSEVLPRIALFCADERFQDVPVVVNDGLHRNILESLYLLVGPRREVIALPPGRAISFDLLYVTAATGYVPFDRRSSKLRGYSHGAFSPAAFRAVRDAFHELGVQKPDETTAKRIYLRRNSGTRRVVNNLEIERLLVDRGFSIVEPESLTFVEQLSTFRWADMVIAATGAACANIVFCRPGTRVAILMGKHKDMPYRYWANMACPLGVDVGYVLGEIAISSRLGIHGDFSVDPKDLIDFIESTTRP